MSTLDLLVRLYPKPFREQWGADVLAEARRAGWRAAPNLALSVMDQWLHPTMWPADRETKRLSRACAMLSGVTLSIWVLAYLAVDDHEAPAGGLTGTRALNTCAALMVAGLLLVAPTPRLTLRAAVTVLRRATVRLGLPMGLGVFVVASVHVDASPPEPVRLVVLACWWSALVLIAIRSPRIITDLTADVATPPRPGRLRANAWLLTSPSIFTGGIILSRAVDARAEAADGAVLVAFALALAVLLLAMLFLSTQRDLRDLSATH